LNTKSQEHDLIFVFKRCKEQKNRSSFSLKEALFLVAYGGLVALKMRGVNDSRFVSQKRAASYLNLSAVLPPRTFLLWASSTFHILF